jgi:hypothetical protein
MKLNEGPCLPTHRCSGHEEKIPMRFWVLPRRKKKTAGDSMEESKNLAQELSWKAAVVEEDLIDESLLRELEKCPELLSRISTSRSGISFFQSNKSQEPLHPDLEGIVRHLERDMRRGYGGSGGRGAYGQ